MAACIMRLHAKAWPHVEGGAQGVVVEGVEDGDQQRGAGVAVDGREVARAVGARLRGRAHAGRGQRAGAALRAGRRVLVGCVCPKHQTLVKARSNPFSCRVCKK